jgi:hypothetical protein
MAHISYDLPDDGLNEGDLEKIIGISTKIRSGRDWIESQYPDLHMGIALPVHEMTANYQVYLKGDDNAVKNALTDFIKICGAPNFVLSGYALVEEVLKPFGKRLKRKLCGVFDGKHVIDIKS